MCAWIARDSCGSVSGRSNGLFAGSLRSGERAAAIMSLVQSARANGHDPYAYLKNALTRLPKQRASEIDHMPPGLPPICTGWVSNRAWRFLINTSVALVGFQCNSTFDPEGGSRTQSSRGWLSARLTGKSELADGHGSFLAGYPFLKLISV